MAKKKTVARAIEDAVDEGATTAEEIHKSIAELPLKILAESDVLRKPVKEVRRVQERAIGAVYDLIRKINHEVGSVASDVLAQASAAKPGRAVIARKGKRSAVAHAH
jgi:histone H3/H4